VKLMNIHDNIFTTKQESDGITFFLGRLGYSWAEINKIIIKHKISSGNNNIVDAITWTTTVALAEQKYYTIIKPLILPHDTWLFQQSERRKVKESFQNQITWIDAVKR